MTSQNDCVAEDIAVALETTPTSRAVETAAPRIRGTIVGIESYHNHFILYP